MAELKPTTVTVVELTKREYAAIHLCIPDSGDADLDAMIRMAQRERLAGQIVAGSVANVDGADNDELAKVVARLADALIAALEGVKGKP